MGPWTFAQIRSAGHSQNRSLRSLTKNHLDRDMRDRWQTIDFVYVHKAEDRAQTNWLKYYSLSIFKAVMIIIIPGPFFISKTLEIIYLLEDWIPLPRRIRIDFHLQNAKSEKSRTNVIILRVIRTLPHRHASYPCFPRYQRWLNARHSFA